MLNADLLPLVYDELRKLAAARLAQEKPGQTLQATALVHDAYIRLADADPRAGEILDVHDALGALANESPVKAELVKLRNFGGLSHQKAADSLGLSRATANRY